MTHFLCAEHLGEMHTPQRIIIRSEGEAAGEEADEDEEAHFLDFSERGVMRRMREDEWQGLGLREGLGI